VGCIELLLVCDWYHTLLVTLDSEYTATSELHCRYFHRFLLGHTKKLQTERDSRRLVSIGLEELNILTAVNTAIDSSNWLIAEELLNHISAYYYSSGNLTSGMRTYADAEKRCVHPDATLCRAISLTWFGSFNIAMGKMGEGAAALAKARKLAEQLGSRHLEAQTGIELAFCHAGKYEWDEARALAASSKLIFDELNETAGSLKCLDLLSQAAENLGEYQDALSMREQGLAGYEKIGMVREIAVSHIGLGNLHGVTRNFDKAQAHFEYALLTLTQIGDELTYTQTLYNLGVVLADKGDLDASESLWTTALSRASALGMVSLIPLAAANLAEYYRRLGNWSKAIDFLLTAMESVGEDALRLPTLHTISISINFLLTADALFPAAVAMMTYRLHTVERGQPIVNMSEDNQQFNLARMRDALGEERFLMARKVATDFSLSQVVDLIASSLAKQ